MPSLPQLPSLRTAGKAPADSPVRLPAAQAVVDCAVYVDGRRLPGRFGFSAALANVRERGSGFVWVGLHEPDERQMSDVARCYGIHSPAAEDAVQAHQRPKLAPYDDLFVLVLRTVQYVEHDVHTVSDIVHTGEVLVFVGPDFAITVRHGAHTGLVGVRSRLEARPDLLALGPSAVLHAVADHVVDTYVEVTGRLERDVDVLEEDVFSPAPIRAVEPIYQLKREVLQLRRSVGPLAGPLQRLSHSTEFGVPKEIRHYLRDVADHHTLVAERITEFDESLSALIDTALAKVAMQQNSDMRKISAWVAIAAVPTMLAGIYGMNFDNMPELHLSFGYHLLLAVIAILCGGLYLVFHRVHWL
ncbi:magnesium and cobalt transport protein CorA [Skermania piniformis]|uniref:Magnesium and cobalt transport protein CorA n=1 Tax=Skermania pinensis TaxID=39122 RepID=A0ABX8SBP0_9ACTN|nr:magnesium and cobalt transport protein CorA [Skermania piniformis]QXQ13126.1 magnesium and cobalt transport protein CorA [Skermania piniformis]